MTNKKNIVIKVKYPTPRSQDEESGLPATMVTEWNVKRIVVALGAIVLVVSLVLYFGLSEPENSAPSSQVSEKTVASQPNENDEAKPEPIKDIDKSDVAAVPEKESDQPVQFKLSEAGQVISPQTMDQIKENIRSEKAAVDVKEKIKESPISVKKKAAINERHNKVIRAQLAGKIINKEPVHILSSPIRVTRAKTVWINYFTELKGMNKETIYHEWIRNDRVVYKHRIHISADHWRAASRKPFNHTSGGQWRVRTVDQKGRLLDQKEFTIILDR